MVFAPPGGYGLCAMESGKLARPCVHRSSVRSSASFRDSCELHTYMCLDEDGALRQISASAWYRDYIRSSSVVLWQSDRPTRSWGHASLQIYTTNASLIGYVQSTLCFRALHSIGSLCSFATSSGLLASRLTPTASGGAQISSFRQTGLQSHCIYAASRTNARLTVLITSVFEKADCIRIGAQALVGISKSDRSFPRPTF